MNLENTLKKLCDDLSLHGVDDEILMTFVLAHTSNDEIGVFPNSNDNPVKVIEYILLGFFKECETLLLAKELCYLEDTNTNAFNEIVKYMKENYSNFNEVVKKIEIVNPNSIVI